MTYLHKRSYSLHYDPSVRTSNLLVQKLPLRMIRKALKKLEFLNKNEEKGGRWEFFPHADSPNPKGLSSTRPI